jgi:hypothetical protein
MTESLEGDLPPDAGDDAARESNDVTNAPGTGPGGAAGGAGEGISGQAPDPDGPRPGEGPEEQDATGITGDPDEG